MPLPKFKLIESKNQIEVGYKYLIIYEDDNMYSGGFYRGSEDDEKLYFLTNSKRIFLYYKIREIYKIIE